MNAEIDCDLTPVEWEILKALRMPASESVVLDSFVLERLMALDLVAIRRGARVITPKGRTVLIRGSSRLWDLAA